VASLMEFCLHLPLKWTANFTTALLVADRLADERALALDDPSIS
jgi:hypothetical protein